MAFLLLAVASSAAMTLVMKLLRAQRGNRFALILGNYLTCIVLSFAFLPDKHLVVSGSPLTLRLGLVGGVVFVAGLVSMQSSIRVNGATLSAAFAKLGLIVSLAVGILCFGERPSALQLAGIALVLPALVLINAGDGAGERAERPALLILTLLCCGGGDAMAKVFQQLGESRENALFFFWLFTTAALLSAVLAALERKRTGQRILPGEFAAGLLVGIPNYFSSYLLLLALERVPSFVAYPLYSTGTIVLVTAVSAACFGEKPGRRQAAGLVLILAALALLSLG